MPGILPMKTIKFGTTAQSRIAQACDRCRSKKIRCDGIRPCCSQCSNVGFECKTSDKLSRRAFPRGYTESLEERVRALEAEVRELKDLLDEKDEKIDILTRIDPGSATRRRSSQSASSTTTTADPKSAIAEEVIEEDTFQVQQLPFLTETENSDTYSMGASSGRAFVDAFKSKAQGMGTSCPDFRTEDFFPDDVKASLSPKSVPGDDLVTRASPRLVSDQMVNIFFQEWAPLFPILHRPTFLKLYERYITDPEGTEDHQSIAQLNLVFGIAALSAEWTKQDVSIFETQWQAAVSSILSENTLATLQCLALAQIYCVLKSDYGRVVHYKGVAIGLSYRLGLHQSQKRFPLGALSTETRKKLFWSLYTVDCFSAALLGLPKLFKDSDIHAEYPTDIDNENVNERGFQSTLPGESTRLSSALALFRVARVLSRVLDENYPVALSHDLSLQRISALNDELESWVNSLAPHLRLHFAQDKPSTNVTSSRSPLLSLAYYYIRTLIYRPAVGSSLGSKASPALIALTGSSKHMIQIIQLLEERRMSFSFCLNKNEVLLLSGFALLYQSLDLNRDSKLVKDSQRLACSVVEILERNNGIGALAFKDLACSLIPIEHLSKAARPSKSDPSPRGKSNTQILAPKELDKSSRKQLQLIASHFSLSANRPIKQESHQTRRTTLPMLAPSNLALYARNSSQPVLPTYIDDPSAEYRHFHAQTARNSNNRLAAPIKPTNLDYLSFSSDPPLHLNRTRKVSATTPGWNTLVGCLDPGQDQSYDDIVSSPDILSSSTDAFSTTTAHDWSAKTWDIVTELDRSGPANSVFSVSEESLTSGEDLSGCDLASEYPGMMMPNDDSFQVLDHVSGCIKIE